MTRGPDSPAEATVRVPTPNRRSTKVSWKDTSFTFDRGMSLPCVAISPVRVIMRRLVSTYRVVAHLIIGFTHSHIPRIVASSIMATVSIVLIVPFSPLRVLAAIVSPIISPMPTSTGMMIILNAGRRWYCICSFGPSSFCGYPIGCNCSVCSGIVLVFALTSLDRFMLVHQVTNLSYSH